MNASVVVAQTPERFRSLQPESTTVLYGAPRRWGVTSMQAKVGDDEQQQATQPLHIHPSTVACHTSQLYFA